MKLIVGLGNPGNNYQNTPHNIGFAALDQIAQAHHADWKEVRRFNAFATKFMEAGQTVHLLKPLTYMNLSGQSVAPYLRYYEGTPADLLVLSDECELSLGRLRLKGAGSAGGHKGLASIIEHLGTTAFARLRLGIGRPQGRMSLADYVLRKFTPESRIIADDIADIANEVVLSWLHHGLNDTMNRFNRWQSRYLPTEETTHDEVAPVSQESQVPRQQEGVDSEGFSGATSV